MDLVALNGLPPPYDVGVVNEHAEAGSPVVPVESLRLDGDISTFDSVALIYVKNAGLFTVFHQHPFFLSVKSFEFTLLKCSV